MSTSEKKMTIRRITIGDGLKETMLSTPTLTHIYCDIDEWIADLRNVALGEDGNYGVFEYEYPGVFTGHYFFDTARGKEARALAAEMLHQMFLRYGANSIRGLTPVDHKAARWMNRQLGFKSYGVVDTVAGPCEVYILSLHEFYLRRNGQKENKI